MADVLPAGASGVVGIPTTRPSGPVTLTELKRTSRERVRRVYKLRSTSARKGSGERVNLLAFLDDLLCALVRGQALYFTEAVREMGGKYSGTEANKKRVARFLKALTRAELVKKDSMGRYHLTVAVELTAAEIDALFSKDIVGAGFRRIEAELTGVREELRRLNTMMAFFANLATQKGQPGPKQEENR